MGKCTQKEYKAEPESNCLYHFFFFSFFLPEQRLAVKLPELIPDEQRCVWVKKELWSQEIHFSATGLHVSGWFVWFCLGWLVPRPFPVQRSVFLLRDWSWYVAGSVRKANDSSRTLSTPPQHTCLHTKRAEEENEQKKVRGDHPPSLYLFWSLGLGLYIGLAPTVWEPSIFLREERVHGHQNVSRGWLRKSNTSAWCVNWLYALAQTLENA